MKSPGEPRELFVYGSLMEGGIHADLMPRGGLRLLGPARSRGRLYDLGSWPGFVAGGRDWVAGELYRLEDPGSLFSLLDGMERQAGFERRITEVHWRHGPTSAWAFHYTGEVDGATVIRGGSWRAHERSLRRGGGSAGEP